MQQRSRRASAKQLRVTDEDMLNEEEYDVGPARMPTSARRYQSIPDVRTSSSRSSVVAQSNTSQKPYTYHNTGARRTAIPPRRTATQTSIPAVQSNRQRNVHTDDIPLRSNSRGGGNKRKVRFHWLVFAGLAMIIMIIGWIALSALGSWWQITQDDWHYGRPRTFQTDAVVGHNDSSRNPSHFIAMNLNRHILIIELPGGDTTKARIYSGPILIGQGQDLAAVTLSFQDVNGDGRLDMIINVQDAHFVFTNDGVTFHPSRSN